MDKMLGGTSITYLGHSTFRFITAGGEQIIIDPWLADNPQTPEDLKQVDELHTILVTHGHFDHFDDAIPLDGGRRLLAESLGRKLPRLELVWADGAYTGGLREWAKEEELGWRVEVPYHRDRQLWRYGLEEKPRGFRVLPRRWVVERRPSRG